jgi:chemotaxis protein MotB
MARRKKKEQKENDPNGWLATYADMITLLMCFFVIMFNPDDITQEQINLLSSAAQQMGSLGSLSGGLTLSA